MIKQARILLLIFAFILSACGVSGAAEPTPTPAPTPIVAQKPTYTVARGEVTRTLRLTGRVTPVQQQDLFFRADGFVREVYVKRGDTVNEGDVLARLDDPEKFLADLSAAELALEQARVDLEKLILEAPVKAAEAQQALVEAELELKKAQNRRTYMNYDKVADDLIIQKAEAEYLTAKQRVKEAQKAFDAVAHKKLTNPERMAAVEALLAAKQEMDRALSLYNWYLLPHSPADVAQADADLALAEAEYTTALAEWERLKDGPDEHDLRLAEAKVADAEARLAIAQKALENIELRAPFSGQVLSIALTPGSQVTAFRPVLTMADPSQLNITAFPTQEELRDLGVGQPAVIQLSSRQGQNLTGRITQTPIAETTGGQEQGQQQDQALHIALDDPDIPLTLGEVASITIQVESREDVLWLPVAALRTFQGRDFVFVEENGIQRRVDVVLGLRSNERVEIVEGLQEGQTVIGQ